MKRSSAHPREVAMRTDLMVEDHRDWWSYVLMLSQSGFSPMEHEKSYLALRAVYHARNVKELARLTR